MSQEESEKCFYWFTLYLQELCDGEISFQSSKFSTRLTSSEYRDANTSEDSFNVNWRLLITSNLESIEKTERQYISLFVRKVKETVFHVPVLKVTFSIRHILEGRKFSRSKIILDAIEKQHYGFSDFISIHDFKKMDTQNLIIDVDIEEMETFFHSTPLDHDMIGSDVELRIGEKIYTGHKFILAMRSRFFQEEFGSLESISHFQVKDTEQEVFEELLKYMYTGKVQNLEEKAFILFQAAVKYGIYDLISKCVDILIKNIELENVVSIISACERDSRNTRITELIRECTKFIRNNFADVMNLDCRAGLVKTEPRYLVDILIDICAAKIETLDSVKMSNILLIPNSHAAVSEQSQVHYEKFLNSEKMKDIDIYVGKNKYFAHSLVLADRSPVFDAMFSLPMKESISGEIHIDDIEPIVFYEVLRFMYTNKVDESKSIEQKILVAANKYQINDLKLLCECILERKLETQSAVDLIHLWTFADDNDAEKLKEKCLYHVLKNICCDKIDEYKVHLESIAETHAHLVLELMKKLVLYIFEKNLAVV